jgi:hypothetical protein
MKVKSLLAAIGLGLMGLGFGWFAPVIDQPAYAQRGAAVQIPIRVNPGDTFDLTMNISAAQEGTVSYQARLVLGLSVEEMGPQGGIWRWSIEDFAIQEFSIPGEQAGFMSALSSPGFNQAMAAATRLATDLDFVCRVDARGACVELLNWPQWRERFENIVLITSGSLMAYDAFSGAENDFAVEATPSGGMGQLQQSLGGQAPAPAADGAADAPSAGPDMGMIAAAIEAVSGVILDSLDGRMIGSYLNTPGIIDVQGASLRVGETQNREVLYPLPFATTPMRMTGTVTLEEVDRRAGVARFSRQAELDLESLTASLTSMVQNGTTPIMGALLPILPEGAMGEDPQASAEFIASMTMTAMASFELTSEETGTVEVDLNTGLARAGTFTQMTTMSAPDGTSLGNTTASYSFTLTPAGPRGPRLGAGAVRPQ